MRVHSLYVVHTAKQAVPRMTGHIHQQPGNRLLIQRVHVGYGLARDLAAIFQFPGGSGGMLPDYFIFSVTEFGLGRFEYPTELAIGCGLAGVDLRSRSMCIQDNLRAGGRLDAVGNIRRSVFLRRIFRLGMRHAHPENEDAKSQDCGRRSRESSHEGDCSRGEI